MYKYSRTDPPLPGLIDQERFWQYVRVSALDECWPWRTAKPGTFWWRVGEKLYSQKSSRLAYRLSYGESLPGDRVVAHTCDYKPCCNPSHLVLQTQRRNNQDAVDRGLNPYLLNQNYRITRQAAGKPRLIALVIGIASLVTRTRTSQRCGVFERKTG